MADGGEGAPDGDRHSGPLLKQASPPSDAPDGGRADGARTTERVRKPAAADGEARGDSLSPSGPRSGWQARRRSSGGGAVRPLTYVREDALIGRTIGNLYEVLAVIGVGGFGVIYRVMHRNLGKILALKLLHRHAELEPEIVMRFEREAQSTSQIEHENVVSITDYGYDPEHGYYMVMEYLEGLCLADLLDTEAPLDSLRALVIAKQVANALAVAHARGVVHRDLKPENIMVMRRYRRPDLVKVLDFGVAYVQSTRASRVTGMGIMVGSPCYMSPEQVKAEKVDFRSDIYSLGIVMYEMLTGSPPFDSDNFFEIVMMHVNKEPAPPRVARPELDIHPELESIVLRCLEKNPKRRYRSMYTVCEALDAAERIIIASSYEASGPHSHRAEPRPERREIQFIKPAFASELERRGE